MNIILQRIYEDSDQQGLRVLVDRLWPRGISKSDANLDAWWKNLAPSTELRKWFGHDPKKWKEFRRLYLKELSNHKNLAKESISEVHGKLILLYGAKDEKHTHARVLREYLQKLSNA